MINCWYAKRSIDPIDCQCECVICYSTNNVDTPYCANCWKDRRDKKKLPIWNQLSKYNWSLLHNEKAMPEDDLTWLTTELYDYFILETRGPNFLLCVVNRNMKKWNQIYECLKYMVADGGVEPNQFRYELDYALIEDRMDQIKIGLNND